MTLPVLLALGNRPESYRTLDETICTASYGKQTEKLVVRLLSM